MITIEKDSAKKKLKFNYKKNNASAFCYISHPESGGVVIKTTLTEEEHHTINVEHLTSGVYCVIIIDGEDILKKHFKKY
ncbi:MAG: hypothetical protein IT239_03800 [Bacteroidia bacterium]|nr:hypothetical protein [Bacteroidia bacterium]